MLLERLGDNGGELLLLLGNAPNVFSGIMGAAAFQWLLRLPSLLCPALLEGFGFKLAGGCRGLMALFRCK